MFATLHDFCSAQQSSNKFDSALTFRKNFDPALRGIIKKIKLSNNQINQISLLGNGH